MSGDILFAVLAALLPSRDLVLPLGVRAVLRATRTYVLPYSGRPGGNWLEFEDPPACSPGERGGFPPQWYAMWG